MRLDHVHAFAQACDLRPQLRTAQLPLEAVDFFADRVGPQLCQPLFVMFANLFLRCFWQRLGFRCWLLRRAGRQARLLFVFCGGICPCSSSCRCCAASRSAVSRSVLSRSNMASRAASRFAVSSCLAASCRAASLAACCLEPPVWQLPWLSVAVPLPAWRPLLVSPLPVVLLPAVRPLWRLAVSLPPV